MSDMRKHIIYPKTSFKVSNNKNRNLRVYMYVCLCVCVLRSEETTTRRITECYIYDTVCLKLRISKSFFGFYNKLLI